MNTPARTAHWLPVAGMRLPICQAPMAGAQGPRLALAVCQAGGLGAVPAGMLSPQALEMALREMGQQDAPYGVNFFCHQAPVWEAQAEARWRQRLNPYAQACGVDWAQVPAGATRHPFDAAGAAVLEGLPAHARPAVVSFHFGLPEPSLLARVKALGAQVWSSATTPEEARWLVQHGADAVIAQGLEAGGHRGHFLHADLHDQLPLAELLPAVLAAVANRVPVIAAGGISTPQDVQTVLAAGAAAAQVGTAYLHCPQADTSAVHRAALLRALTAPEASATALTNLYSGRPARGLVNRLMREIGPMCTDAPAFPLASAAVAPLRAWAERQGLDDYSPLWAGARCHALGASAGLDAQALTRWLAGVA